jgi:hypothetical protein
MSVIQNRSESEKVTFQKLLNSCISERDMGKPQQVDKIEQAITEIPEGISTVLDEYREAYRCAVGKERLLKDIEKKLKKGVGNDETK